MQRFDLESLPSHPSTLVQPSSRIPPHTLTTLTHANPAVGQISLPSTTLRFFDLGGQSTIRAIWEKYYDECHAVVFVLDGADQARLAEGWAVFGAFLLVTARCPKKKKN